MESGDTGTQLALWRGSPGEPETEVDGVRGGGRSTKIPQANGETWSEQRDESA